MAINKILGGGTPQDDPFAAAKRKIFLGATPAGILIMLVVWGIGLKQNNNTVLDILVLPLLTFLFLILIVLLWRRIMPLHTFELIFYTLVLAYALWEFVFIILTIIQTNGSFDPSFMLWLPFIYIMSFLVLKINRALLLSVSFYFATLILGLACCLYFLYYGLAFQRISFLLQMYFTSAFYIAALYLVARLKEQYVSERLAVVDMSKLATTDSLTQLNNRHILTKYLKEEVIRAERHNLPLSVLLFDLDQFKNINDSFGHNTGDEVLLEIAQHMRQTIRTSDPFGRWGGDEFLCLATNTDGKKAVELAERLRDTLRNLHFTTVGKVTASFGVTTYQRGDLPETLIRRADLGLYKAKANGGNRVEAVLAGITLPIFEGEKPYPPVPGENDGVKVE
jgi:diguanylate cyclase (GGDEF)-like protein